MHHTRRLQTCHKVGMICIDQTIFVRLLFWLNSMDCLRFVKGCREVVRVYLLQQTFSPLYFNRFEFLFPKFAMAFLDPSSYGPGSAKRSSITQSRNISLYIKKPLAQKIFTSDEILNAIFASARILLPSQQITKSNPATAIAWMKKTSNFV